MERSLPCGCTMILRNLGSRCGWMNEASLLDQVREAGTAFGDQASHYETLPSGSSRLRTLLKQKAALLVLDDVLEATHLEPFRTDEWSGPRVRILFTTRDRSIGLQRAAEVIALAPLTEGQSAELLTKWARREDPAFGRISEPARFLLLFLFDSDRRRALLLNGLLPAELVVPVLQMSDHLFQLRYTLTRTFPGRSQKQ